MPQSFSFSKKRALCCARTQEEMRYEGLQGKAPPMTRRRMIPPRTPPVSRSKEKARECERKNDHCKNETVFGKELRA